MPSTIGFSFCQSFFLLSYKRFRATKIVFRASIICKTLQMFCLTKEKDKRKGSLSTPLSRMAFQLPVHDWDLRLHLEYAVTLAIGLPLANLLLHLLYLSLLPHLVGDTPNFFKVKI